jgi:hypothetical protein
MAKSQSQRPFEVYCHRCIVSFPAEARRCLHCGSRLARDPLSHDPLSPGRLSTMEVEEFLPVEVEEEAPRRSPFSPMALIWVVLLAVGSIHRACSGA